MPLNDLTVLVDNVLKAFKILKTIGGVGDKVLQGPLNGPRKFVSPSVLDLMRHARMGT